MEELFSKIMEGWFLSEPALFATYCTHTIEQNTKMCVPMRCGKMRIEYNPDILKDWDRKKIEERLKYEVIRILLGHPYQRQPYKATRAALGMASDVTLSTLYNKPQTISIPSGLSYEKGLCFEEYYNIVKEYLNRLAQQTESPQYDIEGFVPDGGGGASDDDEAPKNSDGTSDVNKHGNKQSNDLSDAGEGQPVEFDESENDCGADGEDVLSRGNGLDDEGPELDDDEDPDEEPRDSTDDDLAKEQAELAGLWEEDQLGQEAIREVIARTQRTKQWGSLAGHLSDMIEASAIVKIDYRRILSSFRATVLSSKRRLTRMRPSRRYGFSNMGSKRDFSTNLLVAVDVSGSVDNRQVSQALSIINRFFKYGVENIDVIQFDYGLQGEPISLRKARKTLKIEGRGGTEFQSALDYFAKEGYDGLLMITDGYAATPTLPENTHGTILWMIYNDRLFREGNSQTLDEGNQWIATFPKSRYIILPPV